MEKGVNEKDWKLFRSRLPGWQETYMERIVEEYRELLGSEDQASEQYGNSSSSASSVRSNPAGESGRLQ